MGRGGSAASATPSSSSPRPAAFPVTTPEPLVLVTPPRCLTANRTQQGVLLSWLPPANHSFPIDRYILEFRVGERWETLDDGIPGTELDFFARDLSQVWSLVFAGSDRELLLESLGAQVSGGCLHTATPALLLSQGCCQGLGKVCKFRASPEGSPHAAKSQGAQGGLESDMGSPGWEPSFSSSQPLENMVFFSQLTPLIPWRLSSWREAAAYRTCACYLSLLPFSLPWML